MKLFVNRKIRRNPWGGGIHFLSGLVDYLTSTGHTVTNTYDLDVDTILMLDPRDDEGFGSINDLIQYRALLKTHGKKFKLVHRINDSDIARGTNFLESLNISANHAIADETVFISEWLQNHYIAKGFLKKSHVIRNGTNLNWFYPPQTKQKNEKLKVVTHHWSDNYNKGFDAYIHLDKLLDKRKDIEFTYVGRYYKGYTPTNTKIVHPLYGKELGDELRKHDVYITAARHEACGMHHIEAAACGLPILYHKDGGGINEICKNHGVEFSTVEEIEKSLDNISKNKEFYSSKIDLSVLDNQTVYKKYFDILT